MQSQMQMSVRCLMNVAAIPMSVLEQTVSPQLYEEILRLAPPKVKRYVCVDGVAVDVPVLRNDRHTTYSYDVDFRAMNMSE